MIYSNRLIRDGKVKLPATPDGCWQVVSTYDGACWLQFTAPGFVDHFPLVNTPGVSEQEHYRKVENAGISIFNSYLDTVYDGFVDATPVVDPVGEIIRFPLAKVVG